MDSIVHDFGGKDWLDNKLQALTLVDILIMIVYA
jgi:hypothetical protein